MRQRSLVWLDELGQGRRGRQGREPVLGRGGLALRPLDQDPLLGTWLVSPFIAMRRRARTAAKREASSPFVPARHVTCCQAASGRDRASFSAESGFCSGLRRTRAAAGRARSKLGRQRRCSGWPQAGRGLDAETVVQAQAPSGPCGRLCRSRIRHRPARDRAAAVRPVRHGSDPARSPAWSGSRSPRARQPSCAARDPGPRLRAGRGGRPPAGWPGRWPARASRPPGSCPVCRAARSIAAPPRPSAGPSWESRCHRRSRPGSGPGSRSSAEPSHGPGPAKRSSDQSPLATKWCSA